MKVEYNKLLHRLDELDRNFSILVSYAESLNNHTIPNSDLVIIDERVKEISKLMTNVYDIFNKYRDS